MDFQMSGASGAVQFITSTVPFMNARMQGLYKMGRAAMEDPKAFAIKGGMVSLASLALWALFKDDDRYKELEDFDRWTYYHFWIGDQHFRIPKPFETGALFSTLPEAFANVATTNEEAGHILDTITQITLDTFAFNPVPQLAKPILEVYFNRNMFTDRPIVGERLKGLPSGLQYEPWTHHTAKLAGKLGISPKKAEHIIRGYFSTVGAFSMFFTDIIAKQVGDYPDMPKTINDYPLVGRFLRSVPARNTKFRNEFYQLASEMDKTYRAVKSLQQFGEADALQKIRDNDANLLRWRRAFNRVRSRLSIIGKRERYIINNKALPIAEKRNQLDALILQKNAITQKMYENYTKSKQR